MEKRNNHGNKNIRNRGYWFEPTNKIKFFQKKRNLYIFLNSYRYGDDKMENHIVSGVVPPQTYKEIKKLVEKGKYKNISSAICELLKFAILEQKEQNS